MNVNLERGKQAKKRDTPFTLAATTLAELFPLNVMFKTPESSVEEDCTAAEDSMGCKTAEEAMGCMTAEDSMGSTAAEDLTEESSEVVPFEIS